MSYELLRLIWWALLGALLIGFAVMDGFDLGTAMLYPFVARNDLERRVVLNTIGPVWEGNQVWFILGGGAIFAAWPALYAASISGFYLAMFAILAALIFRPLSIVYRSKLPSPLWRAWWDWVLFVTGLVPSIIFGVAFGNLFLGVPFSFDADLRFHADFSLFSLLMPFALLAGLLSVSMIALHGATWLSLKTEGVVGRARPPRHSRSPPLAFALLFVGAGLWLTRARRLFDDERSCRMTAPQTRCSRPWCRRAAAGSRTTTRSRCSGSRRCWRWRAPPSPRFCAAVPLIAFLASAFTCAATIATAGLALFPFLLPSSSQPNASLTVWDASSSKLTLAIMLAVTAIFLPLIVLYTGWVYRVMRGPVKAEDVARDHGAY